jgi:hypothetical protein
MPLLRHSSEAWRNWHKKYAKAKSSEAVFAIQFPLLDLWINREGTTHVGDDLPHQF